MNHQSTPRAPEARGMTTGVSGVAMLFCFLAGLALMWGYDHGRKPIEADASEAQRGVAWNDDGLPPVSSNDPSWGERQARVTMVIYSDFQCPFCSRALPAIQQLKKDYGPQKLRIVWKNMPLSFHQHAKPAAAAAQGVFALSGANAFWKFHDLAFANQQVLSADNFEKWAKEAGVKDLARFRDGLQKNAWVKKVDDDAAEAQSLGVNGTPAFFINGTLLSGALPVEQFKTAIDNELKKANERIGKGLSETRAYAELSKENKKATPPSRDQEPAEDTTTIWKVPLGDSPSKGPKNAPVTIVEFSDFECPYCAMVEGTLNRVFDTYKGKVRLVHKYAPLSFHKRAKPAAYLAIEARAAKGDAGFWKAHDLIFARQKELSDDNLLLLAKEIGVGSEKLKAAWKDEKYEALLETDLDLAERFKAQSMPYFFINGRRFFGAQPFENFQKILDEEVKRGEALARLASGEGLYDALVKDGKEPPPEPEPERKTVAAPSPSAPSKGPANAKVTIQIFSDFQCPACAFAEPTVAKLQKHYDGKVRWVWRDMPLPFHKGADLAAEFAREAMQQKGADAFWKAHDLLFLKQAELYLKDGDKKGELDREKLDGVAKELKLDLRYKTAIDTNSHKAQIDADISAAAKAGINGTPAFIINGYFVSGGLPFAKFRKVIDRALQDAK